jgi:asparagine synthase (glutamine-hydrolysing)
LRRGLFLPEELPALLGADRAAEAVRLYDPLADSAAALEEPSPMGRAATSEDPWLAIHQLETTRYLRHQLLRDSDWAAMAWSVELRVPLVDPALREHVVRSGFAPARRGGKAAAMKGLMPELPAAVLRRRKTGFFVPVVAALTSSPAPRSLGAQSRMLAVLALREHGVELRGERMSEIGELVTTT